MAFKLLKIHHPFSKQIIYEGTTFVWPTVLGTPSRYIISSKLKNSGICSHIWKGPNTLSWSCPVGGYLKEIQMVGMLILLLLFNLKPKCMIIEMYFFQHLTCIFKRGSYKNIKIRFFSFIFYLKSILLLINQNTTHIMFYLVSSSKTQFWFS